MKFKSQTYLVILLCLSGIITPVYSQQSSSYPISYKIFTPFIFNPATSGSKDYFSTDFIANKYKDDNFLMVSGNARIPRSTGRYHSSVTSNEFTGLGIGGFVYNEEKGKYTNTGISGSVAYHFRLDKNALSFISVGVSAKAVLNNYSGDADLGLESEQNTFYNFDIGTYFYNEHIFTGISAVNILDKPDVVDSLSSSALAYMRELFFQFGYKFVLSRPLDILIEPSIIVNYNDSLSGKDMFQPGLKLYVGNFLMGTYFSNYKNTSVFFQYKYPKFSVGAYFALPSGSPYYKDPIVAEFTLGINISAFRSGSAKSYHW